MDIDSECEFNNGEEFYFDYVEGEDIFLVSCFYIKCYTSIYDTRFGKFQYRK